MANNNKINTKHNKCIYIYFMKCYIESRKGKGGAWPMWRERYKAVLQ